MKAVLKRGGLALLNAPPVLGALRRRALSGDPVTILCYHTLRPGRDRLESWLALAMPAFRAQVAWLRRHYDIVSLDAALAPARPRGRPRAVLTFDDGEGAMHDLLLPLVEAEGLPVTIYVATGQIETGRAFWFDRVINALQGAGPIRIDLRARGLDVWQVGPGRGAGRWMQIGAILEALKAVPEDDRDRLADRVVAAGGPPPEDVAPARPLTLAELRTLAGSDLVTIGAHSHGHELLDRLPPARAIDSAVRSRDLLEGWTGRDIRHFAYPNGNHAPDLMAGLADAGFASATVLGDRLAGRDAPRLALPRVSIGRYDSLNRMRLRLAGV